MGLFSKFTNKKEINLYACVNGAILPIEKVDDEVFASKALGDGVGIEPNSNTILSPVDGTIIHISDTKHACAISLADGTEILIHVGIDTVKLEGKGFETFVSEGNKVKKGQKLIAFDRDFISSEGLKSTVMIINTNSDKKTSINLEKSNVTTEDIIFSII